MELKFTKLDKKQLSDKNSMHENTLGSYGKENGSNEESSSDKMIDSDQESSSSSSSEDSQEDELVETEVEPIIEQFQGYSGDNVNLFYSVFFVFLLWVFYEETVVAKMYGIKQSDFIFYLYF